jgi:hypothetical protein
MNPTRGKGVSVGLEFRTDRTEWQMRESAHGGGASACNTAGLRRHSPAAAVGAHQPSNHYRQARTTTEHTASA